MFAISYYRRERGQTKFAGFCDPTNERSIKMFQRLEFENRGVREVKGVREMAVICVVWTLGVGEREEDLIALGLGRKSDN
jgi:RimJ/RimL family protein N-acetyltransferase